MDGKEQEMEDMDKPPFREDEAFTKKRFKTYNILQSRHVYLLSIPHFHHLGHHIYYSFGLNLFFFWEVIPVVEIKATSFPSFLYQAAAP